MTEKENYLRCLRGEQPEWIPMYTFGVMPGSTEAPCNVMVEPYILSEFRRNGGGRDIWGVNFIPTHETGNALIPEPNNFILEDITKWRDVIKAPSLEGIDWEAMVKKDIEWSRIDRSQSALALNLHIGYFQNLMSFMGFTNGLMAFYEEPEEVKALLTYLCDFYCEVQSKVVDLFNPDIIVTMDDTAAWGSSFISPEMYREFILPHHDRQVKVGRDRGLPITMHNCGKAEGVFDDLVKIGVCMWDPAQTCNDIEAVQAKFGNRLVIAGAWDARGRLLEEDVTDEEIVESVRSTMNRYARGGGYVFCGGYLGPFDDHEIARKNRVLHTAVREIGHNFYKG
ncbi:uroporphyrinogen decarboxylase [Spirochaetia bacterium]|nr:uroporphyrinogen decarboxylase [Spirochaetia bacterium]